jgi:hypothetical protein
MGEGGVAMADAPQGEADIGGDGGEVDAPAMPEPLDEEFLDAIAPRVGADCRSVCVRNGNVFLPDLHVRVHAGTPCK